MTDMTTHATPEERPAKGAAGPTLPREKLLRIHDLMIEGRLLEERLIRMQRQGEAYFWIGGPGEEAFNTCLGLLADRGQGIHHDYFHLHYRSSATLLALGGQSIDALRQMHNTVTDPHSRGRNFCGHFSVREWNLVPITSPIEVQYSVAIGTGLAQARQGGRGITIVQGGDAGTAEGDFATCLVWASRPVEPLPMLIIVANNAWGISTPAAGQHGEKRIADRGAAFGMKTMTCDGNDAEAAYAAIKEAMHYVRTERKPLVLECFLSRLYGHSSSSGANYVEDEPDCMKILADRLDRRGWRSHAETKAITEAKEAEMTAWYKQVLTEPKPDASEVHMFTFAERNHVGGEA